MVFFGPQPPPPLPFRGEIPLHPRMTGPVYSQTKAYLWIKFKMSIQPLSLDGFSPHSLAVIPNWHVLCPCNTTTIQIPWLWYLLLLFLPERSLCPLVSDSHRCVMIGKRKCKPHCLSPPTLPLLTCAYAEEETSLLWQQQNTPLQKRCTPLTAGIKKGVDRIRARDDDLREKDVRKEVRRKKKGLSFFWLLFFILFFSFSQDSSSPTWHMSDWGDVNLPRG